MTTEEVVIPEKEVLSEIVEKDTVGIYVGQVKWFDNSQGYGFITIISGSEKGKDIFVHHTGISPANSNYKTLKKGEYINFNIITGLKGLQAVDITGINGGPLMCDIIMGTRNSIDDLPGNSGPRPTGPPHIAQGIPPRPKIFNRGPPGPPGSQPPPPPGPRPVKNYNKYNKATRGIPATQTIPGPSA
jgi:CspA family cold shock protein